MTDKALGGIAPSTTLSISGSASKGIRRNRILAALRTWLRRPRRPPGVPACLRADLGLDPLPEPRQWHDVPLNPSNLPSFRSDRF